MYQLNNFDSYQRQANDLVAKFNQLQQLQQPFALPQPVPQIDYVNGFDGAREYLKGMPANGKKILMDQDQAIFYVVSKDANGIAAPIVYSTFELQAEPKNEPDYVTKQDLEKLKEELKELVSGGKS